MSVAPKEVINTTRVRRKAIRHLPAEQQRARAWSQLLLDDHEGLRMLSALFGRELDPERRSEYLRLALDLHAVHEKLEVVHLRDADLQLLKFSVDDLAEQLDSVDSRTGMYDVCGAVWFLQLEELMAKEERQFRDAAAPRIHLPHQLLRRRQILHAQVAALRH